MAGTLDSAPVSLCLGNLALRCPYPNATPFEETPSLSPVLAGKPGPGMGGIRDVDPRRTCRNLRSVWGFSSDDWSAWCHTR